MYASLVAKLSIINNSRFVAKGHPKKVLRKFMEILILSGIVSKKEILGWLDAITTNVR